MKIESSRIHGWTEDGIQHEAITEKIPREVPCTLVTVILEKPSTSEELDNIKSVVGIVNHKQYDFR